MWEVASVWGGRVRRGYTAAAMKTTFGGGEGEKNGGSRPTPANHRPPGSATLVLQPRCVCNQPFSQEMRLAICFTNRALLALRKAKEPPESRGFTAASQRSPSPFFFEPTLLEGSAHLSILRRSIEYSVEVNLNEHRFIPTYSTSPSGLRCE